MQSINATLSWLRSLLMAALYHVISALILLIKNLLYAKDVGNLHTGRKTLNKHTPWWTKDAFHCVNGDCSEAPEHQRAYQLFDGTVVLFKEKKKPKKKTAPRLRKMADVEMDIASTRMNNGNEHV